MEATTALGRKMVIAGAVTLLGTWIGLARGGCASLTCSSNGGSEMTCQPPTSPAAMCFYQSGRSEAGGRPGWGTRLLFAGFAFVTFLRGGPTRSGR